MTRTRGLSLREGDWHDFEVLETHGAGIDGDAAMSVRLTCDGINGDAFPLNAADGSARRRALALSPWPSLPEDAASSAVSRAVDLVAGEKYWLQLECTMGSARRRRRRRRRRRARRRRRRRRAAVAAAAAGRLRQPAAVQPVGPEQGGERRQPRRLPERQDEQVGLGVPELLWLPRLGQRAATASTTADITARARLQAARAAGGRRGAAHPRRSSEGARRRRAPSVCASSHRRCRAPRHSPRAAGLRASTAASAPTRRAVLRLRTRPSAARRSTRRAMSAYPRSPHSPTGASAPAG